VTNSAAFGAAAFGAAAFGAWSAASASLACLVPTADGSVRNPPCDG